MESVFKKKKKVMDQFTHLKCRGNYQGTASSNSQLPCNLFPHCNLLVYLNLQQKKKTSYNLSADINA